MRTLRRLLLLALLGTPFAISAAARADALHGHHGGEVQDAGPYHFELVAKPNERRATDDPQVVGYFLEPTPGGPNAVSGPGFAPAVGFSVDAGTFTQPFTLSLTPEVAAPGVVIRYTLDGIRWTSSRSRTRGH